MIMAICEYCFEEYDDNIARGVCPYCGYHHGFVPKDPRYLPVGTIINARYAVGGVIGDGGFGITYRAWDTKLKTAVALKEYYQRGVVNRIPGTTAVFIAAPDRAQEFYYGKDRLLREAQIVSKYQSEAIVRVNDFFEENGTSYMVMELLDCPTLEERLLEMNHPFDAAEVQSIAEQLCSALKEIHASDVIHRDIAPDNVFITQEGKIKIIDFGSARLSKEDVVERLILVKEGFSPVEQYEIIDPQNDLQQGWTDIYAAGATLYYCLTGVRPAESRVRKANVDEKKADIQEPIQMNPNVPERLNNIIMKAMAINIHERFSSAEEMQKALRGEAKVLPLQVVRKRKRMLRAAGICGGFLIALCVLIAAVIRGGIGYATTVLKPAEISVWFSIPEGEKGKEKEAALKRIIQTELESEQFSDVSITLTGFESEEYADKLKDAYLLGSVPTLFEWTDQSDVRKMDLYDVSTVIDSLDQKSSDCLFLEEYRDLFEEGRFIPTGFEVPIIYINTASVTDYHDGIRITSMEDILQLSGGEMIYKPIAVDPDAEELYRGMFSDYDAAIGQMTVVGEDEFLSSGAAVYLSTTAEYTTVYNRLDAVAAVELGTEKVLCNFADCWSISNCTEAEQAAARELLAYFFTNNAQEYLYLQISQVNALPLNKSIIEQYPSVQWRLKDVIADCDRYYFD